MLALTSTPVFAQSGTIVGTVTDAVTAAPLASGGSSDLLVTLMHSSGQDFANQATNSLGQYAFTGLTPGTWYVKVRTATTGYISEMYNDVPCVAADCTTAVASPVVVAADATVVVNFALSTGGGFSGTVRRAADASVVGDASVSIYNAATSFVRTVATAGNGTYSVSGLPAGNYFAIASAAGASGLVGEVYGGEDCPVYPPGFVPLCRTMSGTPIAVTVGATTTGIDFSLTPAGSIAGHIVEEGTALPIFTRTRIELYLGTQRVADTFTDSSEYVLANIPPGVYRVRTTNSLEYIDEWYGGHCVGCPGVGAAVVVGPGAAVTGIDFALRRGSQIRGVMNCSASGPTLVPTIYAYSTSGALVKELSPGSGCGVPYVIAGLHAGTYYLVGRDPAFIPFGIRLSGGILIDQLYSGIPCVAIDCDPLRGVPVTVPENGTTTGIDFLFTEGASSNFVSGHPLFGPSLRMFDARGVELTNVLRATFFGLVQIVGIPPGTYFATFGDRLHGRGLCANCPPTAGKPIVIQPGQLQFTLDFGDVTITTISGTVRDASGGGPLSAITVQLLTASGRVVSSAVTNLNGGYSITTLGPGTYYLRTTNERNYVDEVYPNVVCPLCDLRSGTPVVVTTSSVTGIDFTLAAGGLVSGRAADADGMAMAGVPVSLFTPSATLTGSATTALDGRYHITLPAGSYRARAEATATNTAQIFDGQTCSGLSCDVASGTPIAVTAGAETNGVDFDLHACATMAMLPPVLARGVVGTPYRQVFTVSGGSGAFVFGVSSGILPAGVSLTPSGVLAGTPASSGRHEFTVSVVDGSGCSTGRALTLDVYACAFTLSPASATVPAAGGTVTVAIGDSCGPADVDVSGTFVTVTWSSSTQVVFDVPPNSAGAARSATTTIGRRVFVISQGGLAAQPPFGSLDGPADGAQVSGSVGVGGWALDDLEVRRVRIVRDPVGGEGAAQIYLGDAVFVPGARPDVRAAYPGFPNADRAGWGFLILTNMLPNQGNGIFRIYAYAEDGEGQQTLLGGRTIVGVNSTSTAPFGAIDTPAQGATISGSSYINFGWALTPQPKIIPFDGSTIHVLIDSVDVGAPTYNQFRSDIAALFPGLANANGAVGYRAIDTTALAEGLHTIAWYVADSQNAAAGIGSRYFTVTNSADAQSAVAGAEAGRREESVAAMPMVKTSASGDGGSHRARLRALERLELRLSDASAAAPVPDAGGACDATWAGYTIDDSTLAALPIGATIDPAGIFYWQPGPGFSGAFELLFVRTGCDGRKERIPVRVTIDK